MSDDLDRSLERHLDEIERHVRAARGDPVERTPWDFALPTATDLRVMRQQCGLSQAELGEEIGYAEGSIQSIESGSAAPGRAYIQNALRLYKREWPR